MRPLPRNVDADAVLAIGAYLDDQARSVPISVRGSIDEVRKNTRTRLSDQQLEELIIESAAARHLALLLDVRDAN
jgi:hypothetical protein